MTTLELVESPSPEDVPEVPSVEIEPDLRPPLSDLLRPATASALVAVAAGFEAGGIFGSWSARGLAALAAVGGAAFAVFAQRTRRPDTLLLLFPVGLVAVATLSLITAPAVLPRSSTWSRPRSAAAACCSHPCPSTLAGGSSSSSPWGCSGSRGPGSLPP